MDFKKFFTNKFFLIGLVMVIVTIICASLISLNTLFYIVTCVLCAILCFYVAFCFILKINNIKKDKTLELLPLTKVEAEYAEKLKRRKIVSYIFTIIMLVVAGIVFLTMIFKNNVNI